MDDKQAAAALAQYQALTAGVGLVDAADRTWIEVTGDDRARFLNGFCTNDVVRLQVGQGCEAFFTNVKGRILGHAFVFCESERLIIDGVPGQAARIVDHLDRYLIREDVQLHDRSSGVNQWLVGGGRAADLLRQLLGDQLPVAPLTLTRCEIASMPVCVRRVPMLIEPAWLIACAGRDAPQVSAALTHAGATPCAWHVYDQARVEAGFPHYGQDISDDNLPQEVNRDAQAISFTKGCYLGQETVARLDALGHVNRLLYGLCWETGRGPAAGEAVIVAGRAVGQVTSSVTSPRLQTPFCLAYIRREHARVDQRLETEHGVGVVVQLPLARSPSEP
jgi:folate-binding protein YgfZ